MACGPCEARRLAASSEYQWTSADGETVVVYPTLMAAKAKVLRKGGSYVMVTPASSP